MRKQSNKIIPTFLLILISFSAGFAVNNSIDSFNNRNNIKGLINIDSQGWQNETGFDFGNVLDEEDKNEIEEQADFSIFWDAWKIIEDKYTIEELDYQKMVYGAVAGMADSLDDPYTIFLTPEENKMFEQDMSGKFSGIGAEIGIRDKFLTVIAPLKNSPAEKFGLLPGDKILKVDGEDIIDISIDEAVTMIRGERGTEVVLTISREGVDELKEIAVVRDIIIVGTVEWEMMEGNIAYLGISQFNQDTANELDNCINDILIKDPQGVIIDLRNNSGGYLDVAIEVASRFSDAEDTIVIETYKDRRENYKSEGGQKFSDIPIVVLVNKGSASASEILAGALRDNGHAKLVGEKTFGKGLVQEMKTLKDGSALKVTVARWLTPNGIDINENGIEPDIKVELTLDDYLAGADPQLEKALEVLQ